MEQTGCHLFRRLTAAVVPLPLGDVRMACQLLHGRYVRSGVQEIGDHGSPEVVGTAGTHACLNCAPSQDVQYGLIGHPQRHE